MHAALLSLFVVLAPVPQPRPLTAEMMVGQWDYKWGGMADGWIQFLPDGHYFSRHYPGDYPQYCGEYTVHRGVLTLYEARMPCPDDSAAALITATYPVELSTADFPAIRGKYGMTDVLFSNPKR